MKKILLVAPTPLRFELTQDQSFLGIFGAKNFMAPIQLATIAALTPAGMTVEIWDEAVQGRIDDRFRFKDYDLVGLTGFTAHLPRARDVAQLFKSRGVPAVIGGSGISSMPHRFIHDFDAIFIGEAELTWPQFLEDREKGTHRRVYRQVSPVDLSCSPKPRWNSVSNRISAYHVGGVQTSRGCPFDCEFCDVGYLFGHRFRHKPVQNVLEEISQLEKLGVRRIVFCDDNFFGNPQYTKELLREMIKLNNSFKSPLGYAGEASINIAGDDEMLELMAEVNFIEVFIGIESPNKESLKASNKMQNFRSNLIDDIRKIQSYGMSVRGSLIVGFDNDEKDIFDQQFNFVQEAGLTVPSIRVLMAPPGTRLWKRLQREGRLLKTESEGRFFGNPGTTNIIPHNMSRLELHSGYLNLIAKVYAWENFAQRIKDFIFNVKRPAVPKQKLEWKRLIRFARFLLSVDRTTRKHILDILRYTRKHAPFMTQRAIGIIVRQYGYAARPQLQAAIQSQIEAERSGKLTLEIDDGKPVVANHIVGTYEEVFPSAFDAVSRGLGDKSRIEETLIEVFARFIAGNGFGSQPFGDDQKNILRELTSTIIAEKNRMCADGNPGAQSGRGGVVNSNMKSLSAQVLKAIEQDLLIEASAK